MIIWILWIFFATICSPVVGNDASNKNEISEGKAGNVAVCTILTFGPCSDWIQKIVLCDTLLDDKASDSVSSYLYQDQCIKVEEQQVNWTTALHLCQERYQVCRYQNIENLGILWFTL